METINLNNITWRQFTETNFYKKRFNMDKFTMGVYGANKYLSETWEYLKKENAILVDGEKVQFPNEGCLY
mgnify:FL=1